MLLIAEIGAQLYRTPLAGFDSLDLGLDLARGTLIRMLKPYRHRLSDYHLYDPHRNVSPTLRMVEALKVNHP